MILQEVKIKGEKENWTGAGQRESGSAMQSQQNPSHPQGSASAGMAHRAYLELGHRRQAILSPLMQVALERTLGEKAFFLI